VVDRAIRGLLGLGAVTVDVPGQVTEAWDGALRADQPFLIHAVVDPAVPLLPPRLDPDATSRVLAALDKENTNVASRDRTMLLAELARAARASW
jgi:pyruvate dehydrogenase (quinone)